MDKSGRGWLISVICLIVIPLASATQLSACPPPFCGDCQKWDEGSSSCVDDDDQDQTGGYTCNEPDVCGYCQKCSGGACVDDDAGGIQTMCVLGVRLARAEHMRTITTNATFARSVQGAIAY